MNVKSPSSNEHTKSALALAKLQSQLSRGDFEIIFAANLSAKRLVSLSNTHIGRVEKIADRLRSGLSFSKASKYHSGGYDTVSWLEIESRLWRSRGTILNCAAKLYCSPNREDHLAERVGLDSSLTQIIDCCNRIVELLAKQHCSVSKKGKKPGINTEPIKAPNSEKFCLRSELNRIAGFLKKNVNDIPSILELLGVEPTLYESARINVEAMKIRQGAMILKNLVQGLQLPSPKKTRKGFGPFGIGARYEQYLSSAFDETRFAFSIATHKKPDADALVSSWLASRYGLVNDDARIAFVGREADVESLADHCFVVDVGKTHDVLSRRFDHKPPAFVNRDETCATRLIWEWLLEQNLGPEERKNLVELESFVSLVRDGDAVSRRARSQAYKESREAGFHAHVACLRELSESDTMLANASFMWLDHCN